LRLIHAQMSDKCDIELSWGLLYLVLDMILKILVDKAIVQLESSSYGGPE